MTLEAISARLSEEPGETLLAPIQRWHDDAHPHPWQVCPERPCVEVRNHQRVVEAPAILDMLLEMLTDNIKTRKTASDWTEDLWALYEYWSET